ncbi:MAG: dipeptide/oligopeptide/nickel ABC transporter ATP-binding protein, partial [Deltaproteobacteria bacterium]|nr:dipeptide/oligopeptide/nickel ABC transporter ATP-binding protein [Deltaproteobacteria bacterium]MBW2103306.1 dipeptide/oligopeptide/nickel ABC transporter ATP-binding protein [Deltaproteobacteria bacterium]MBW2347587.1 dipeptide/oligopeptide/nickel ABC transporter ATP-binding protein [Deltaproteobacteria bacterium]
VSGPRGTRVRRARLQGDPPSPIDPPSGCRFHPRCDRAEQICKTQVPVLQEGNKGHRVACHLV